MANNWRIIILASISATCLYIVFLYFNHDQRYKNGFQVQVQKYFAGTIHEVAVYTLQGKESGPVLLIFGGIHGDEDAGYLAADRYIDLKIRKGTIIVVPRLNLPAISRGTRHGVGGDMNRLFHLKENSNSTPDGKVVDLAKSLIKRCDYVLNLHQADGFYYPVWVSHKRNPKKWGQCNVIDAPVFDLPNGDKLELACLAEKIANRSNSRIADKQYHFQINNTNTAASKSVHKDQRKSLTYYALYKEHKVSLGIEATRNCTLPQAVAFLTIAINSVIQEIGIEIEELPSEDPLIIDKDSDNKKT